MTLAFLALLAVAVGLAWWMSRRAIEFRREAQSREARVLEALFASRQTADGGASIDVDEILGIGPAAAATTSAEMATGQENAQIDRAATASAAVGAAAGPADTDEIALEAPVPVRDLVQVFFEARGFRPTPADPSARPIEMVLAHKSNALRAYAFAPLAEPPSEAALKSVIDRARGIGQKRVLIAVEGAMAPDRDGELPAHGVRVLDRAAIEAQLSRLDAAVAEKIRATAWRHSGQRLRAS